MAIQLTPEQIPEFWDSIKFGSVHSDRIKESHREPYLNHLLYQLLSGKAQCFIRLNESRELQAICITMVKVDDTTGEKSLLIRNIYSFAKVDIKQWQEDFQHLIALAKKENCKRIYGWSTNQQVVKLSKAFGMKEITRSYGIDI